MYIDARYHIASLAAVLIALGVGLVVGVGLLGGKPLPELTRKAYKDANDRLELELKAEREVRQDLTEQLQGFQAFARAVVPLVVAGRLEGQRAAIISLSDKADGLVDIRQAVASAGGEVIATVELAGIPRPLDDETAAVMAQDFGLAGPGEDETGYSTADLMTVLTKSLTLGVYKKGLAAMVERGWVAVEGSPNRITPSTVLIVLGGNGSDQTDNPMESLFLKALVQRGNRVVGCERSDVDFSSMANLRNVLMATVDDIDQPAGKISLVACVKGVEGDFGTRETAEALLPQRIPE